MLCSASIVPARSAADAGPPVHAPRTLNEGRLTLIPAGAGGAQLKLKPSPDGATAIHTCPVTVPHLLSGAQADPASAGTHIAPGNLESEAKALAIPDGSGGVYVAFENLYNTGFNVFWSAVAHVGSDGLPTAGWLAEPIVGYHRLIGDPNRVSITFARPDRVWLFSDYVSTGEPFFRMVGPNAQVAQDTMGLASRFQEATVATPVGATGDAWLTTAMVSLNGSLALRVGLLAPDGVHDSSLPDILLMGLGPGFGALLQVLPDGGGGVWCTLNSANVFGSTGRDLVTARVLANGQPAWPVAARVVSAAAGDQIESSECSDGAGGAYFAWTDRRVANGSDVYGLHLLVDGSIAPGWPVNGKIIAASAGEQFQPHIAADGAGGCWVVWTDSRTGENDIFFTRLLSNGSPAAGFPAGGLPLCAATGGQIEPQILADGNGGFYSIWLDARDGELDLFGQHIHATGEVTPGWTVGGVALCTEPHPQQDPLLVLASPGHPMALWSDTRAVKVQYQAMTLPADAPLAGAPGDRTPVIALSASGPSRELEFRITTHGSQAATLELFDLHGRRVVRMGWDRPLHDEAIRFGKAGLDPGLYWARLVQGVNSARARAILLR